MSGSPHPTRRSALAGLAAGLVSQGWSQESTLRFPPHRAAAAGAPPFPGKVLTDTSLWDSPGFVEAFQPRRSPTRLVHRFWANPVEVFGRCPHQIIARFQGDPIDSLTLLFLDSGTHFGYIPRNQARQTEQDHRETFRQLHDETLEAVTRGLETLSGERGTPHILGREPMLTQPVRLYRTGDAIARLHAIEDQLIKVVFFREEALARQWIDPAIAGSTSRDRRETFAASVKTDDQGDILIEDIPLLPQGDRAYCGVSALAMGMQRLGLFLDTEDYAAAAGIRYGSTQGSYIREVYDAAGAELGLRMSRNTRFEIKKVQESVGAGLPAIVWRRWSQDRDYLHTIFARKFEKDPTAILPKADAGDRESWPTDRAYNHASVITGFNRERGEIIFSESWTEQFRNRRMRFEEMEGTAYYTFLLGG